MASASSHRLLLLQLAPLLTAMTVNAANPLYHFCIDTNGNFTANSVYHTNLNTVLSDVATDTTIDYGFYNFTSGAGQSSDDRVNALALCRGDVSLSDCRSCLNDSSSEIRQLCPRQKEAILWYDNCMLRYTNRSIFGVRESSPAFYMWNSDNATSVTQFNQVLRGLFDNLRTRAAAGDSEGKFAAGNATAPDFRTLFALAQCTPDLSELSCKDCLDSAIGDIPSCCDSKLGGRVVRPSCNIRFEVYRFYDASAEALPPQSSPPAETPVVTSPPPAATNTTTPAKGSSNTVVIVAVPIAAVCTAAFIIGVCIFLRKKIKRGPSIVSTAEDVDEIKTAESLQVDFETIRAATNNFSEENKLGQGGFGSVYKGILEDGEEIAVKRLSIGMGQGDLEFKNEVLLVAKLQHRNLVRLVGFCLSGSERLLMYEFVPNRSLDHFIFDEERRSLLDWERRYKIIGGIARGLVYLHEDSRLRIIHRDLKASNVLLDAEMVPKIADFGMAKLVGVDQTQGETNRIVGTYGYMAPEYALYGQFSNKSDVFSFGVLLLEIITGQKNNSFRSGESTVEDLLSSAWRNWRKGTITNIIDPTLRDGSRTEMLRCIHIALLCVQENANDRPTMGSVILMLNSFSVTLQLPSQPALYLHTINESSDTSTLYTRANHSSASKDHSIQGSNNEASITDLYPR